MELVALFYHEFMLRELSTVGADEDIAYISTIYTLNSVQYQRTIF